MTTPQSNQQEKPFTIAICGGGIAGLALAIGLHNRNVPFHLYESAHAFAEVGAGVAFGPNSIRAMGLIWPDIRKGFEKRATQNAFESKKDTWFDFYTGIDCGLGKAGEKICEVEIGQGLGQSSIHRATFLDELVALVPKEHVTFGKRVVEVEESSTGVLLKFKDGSSASASAVIGCDGVKSNIRHVVLGTEDPAVHPTFTGKYAYRGLIPMDRAVSLLGDELARNGVIYCGPHAHVLTMPIQKGKIMNVVAFNSKEDGIWEDEKWVPPMDHEAMENDFAEWGESVKKILSLMEKPDIWALFDYPPARTYYKSRVCLLGDAAHASTPHQGAGAGMALEDAYIMASVLGAIQGEGQIEQAFKAFDTVRRPRAQKLVSTSRTNGELYECEMEGVGDDREAMKKTLTTRYRWIWEKRLEEDMEQAVGMLQAA